MAPVIRFMLAVLAAFVAGCATPIATGEAAGKAAGTAPEPVAIKVADGVYMLRGVAGEADGETLGRVGNAGFIVGDTGVIAIDMGVLTA